MEACLYVRIIGKANVISIAIHFGPAGVSRGFGLFN